MKLSVAMTCLSTVFLVTAAVAGQVTDHAHHHEHGEAPVERPKVFLDKSPRIVQYQLNRLDNERLLLVERNTNDPKYAPVYTAILTRAGMSPQYREDALDALVMLNASDAAAELLSTLMSIEIEDRQDRRTARAVSNLLLRLPTDLLGLHVDDLRAATTNKEGLIRAVGHAGLILGGDTEASWDAARKGESSTIDWLTAVSLLPQADVRNGLRQRVVKLVRDADSASTRQAAIRALSFIPAEAAESFRLIAPLVTDKELQTAAVRTLLKVPAEHRDPAVCAELAAELVALAESTSPEERTTDEFIDAMQLADELLGRIPVETARAYRERLRAVTVRVVRIGTVIEEMRYDVPYFAVEAGRPVQVVLRNDDLMAHNLVITVPDALKEVAELGLQAGTLGGRDGKPFVPRSDKVLFATGLVEPDRQEKLTFTAPSELGEYPYVCTFPRHWMRMYGVMIVVDDLEAWSQNPIEPQDPVGNTRPFVQAWTLDDLAADLDDGLRGRSPEIGMRLFTEASCAQCHKVQGRGGTVGPELTDVFNRWKGDRVAVLREILEPSHRIDSKYAVHLILTADGNSLSGIVTAEDNATVSLLVNPEAKEPVVVQRSDIEEMVKTSVSMMPKALLDRFTRDEIYELFAYIEAAGTGAE